MAASVLGGLFQGVGNVIGSTISSLVNSAQSGRNNQITNASNILTSPVSSGSSVMDASSWGGGSGSSWSESGGEGWSRTYGREASAADIMRAAEANEFTREMMHENMAFQAYMSNTAYQRAIEDLRKAGLNPILAALNMGASTPAGAMGTAAKATTFPEQESYSSSWGSSGSQDSNSYGSNEHSESQNSTEPLLKIVAKGQEIVDRAMYEYMGGSAKQVAMDNYQRSDTWKGFDSSGYDPAY